MKKTIKNLTERFVDTGLTESELTFALETNLIDHKFLDGYINEITAMVNAGPVEKPFAAEPLKDVYPVVGGRKKAKSNKNKRIK